MKFPELKIIDRVSNDNTNLGVKELLVVQLDWFELDNYKIQSRKNWYKKYGIPKATKEQSLALKQMLKEVDWLEYLYPQKYKYVFDKYSKFKMTQSYYDECLHLSKMATEEWNRQRPFDTNVRENLLSPATSFVESFFYLINDAIYIYNADLHLSSVSPKLPMTDEQRDNFYFEHSVLSRSLMLFRFWKFQTGGGLVVDRSTEFVKKYNDSIRHKFKLNVNQDLIDNMQFEPFGLARYYPEREEELLKLINQRVRDNKLNNILSNIDK